LKIRALGIDFELAEWLDKNVSLMKKIFEDEYS
jgi:hypothetical protein